MPSTLVQKGLLALSIFLVLAGIGLTIGGAFSPAWQVVDIREFRAEHQMYKFDQSAALIIENSLQGIDDDGAAGEAEHHKFWLWHKIVLFFIITSEILAFISICTGVCAPCFRPTTFAFTISLFIAMLFSLIADGVFFLAANRVDVRFVQGMVGTYEQQIGYAFFLHLLGTLCWVAAFLCAMITTYKFFTGGSQGYDDPAVDNRHFEHADPLLHKPPRHASPVYREPPPRETRAAAAYPRAYRETSA